MAFGSAASSSGGGRLASAFYAVVVCEVLATAAAVTEPLVALLVPYLQQGLRADAAPDQRVASHMVIAQLMTRATLSNVLLSGAQPPPLQPSRRVLCRRRLLGTPERSTNPSCCDFPQGRG